MQWFQAKRARTTVFKNVDCPTGGLTFSDYVVNELKDRVNFIAPVLTYPGEHEMLALAQGVLRVLRKEEIAKEYTI